MKIFYNILHLANDHYSSTIPVSSNTAEVDGTMKDTLYSSAFNSEMDYNYVNYDSHENKHDSQSSCGPDNYDSELDDEQCRQMINEKVNWITVGK